DTTEFFGSLSRERERSPARAHRSFPRIARRDARERAYVGNPVCRPDLGPRFRGDERNRMTRSKIHAAAKCHGRRQVSATPFSTSYNFAMGYQYLGGTKRSFWEDSMLSLRFRPLLALCAVAAVLAFAMTDADARAGRGGSFGSRGSQTFSAPPSTA